ncbi:MAG: Serine/arginine repetitive matrix protein 2 [Nocardioides sp.]|nr:Serine/arginine repetitive matrix protein 2 [Nocardioides sp.]
MVDWNDPPSATAKAQWSKKDESGRTVKGSFRTICHLNRLNNLAMKKFGKGVGVIQPPFNTTVPASAGTHGFTLPPREGQVVSDDFQVAGFEVGIFVNGGFSHEGGQVTSSQIEDYYNHAFGLAGQHEPNSDTSWFPDDIKATIFDLPRYIARRAG